MPDILIPRDTSHITSYYNSVMNKGLLYQFTIEYAARNYKSLSAFKTYQDLYAYLQQLPVLSEFTDYAEHKGVKKRPMLINISRNLIEKSIQSYIVRHFFDYAGFYPVFQKDDVTLRRAVQVLEEGRWRPEIPAEEKGKP